VVEVGHALAVAIGAGFAAFFALAAANTAVEPGSPIQARAATSPAADLSAHAPQDAGTPAAKPASPAPLTPPPPRAPVAGLRGFESRSRLEYPSQPGRPHELRAAYVFPERVRWWMGARDGAVTQRRMRYQYGQHVLAVEPPRSESLEYRAEDRAALLAAFEMRRALFLWPDDRKWTGTGATRTSVLPNGDTLRAEVSGKPPRPVALEYVAAGSAARDVFRAITWSDAKPRAWPATFEVWNGATLAWREVVDAVDVETRFIDSFFIPPDRRGVVGKPVDELRDLDIPPTCLRRVELAKDATWAVARAERERLQADARARELPDLEDWFTIEVRADGTPAAVLVRLARIPEALPEGFATLPDRIGIARSVTGLDAVNAEVIQALTARLPAGAVAGKAYVRFDGSRSDGDVVVVVPVE
jgi:hypothetical protein